MRLIFSLMFLCGTLQLFAQRDTTAPFLRFPTVPPFSIESIDGKLIAKGDLKKNTPLLIMYFSPGCEHCQTQTRDIKARIKDLQHIQILMASYQSMEDIKAYTASYGLNQFSNILIGRDNQFLLPPFFNIGSLPFLALYDKKGKLISIHEGNLPVSKLLESFGK